MGLSDLNIANIFLPKRCLHCDRLINSIQFLCSECLSSIELTSEQLLKKEYQRKFAQDKTVDDFFSPFIFTSHSPLQTLIHTIKYEEGIFTAKYIAGLILHNSNNILTNWNADYIIPMPLHPVKKAERGYNQTELIVKQLRKNLKLKTLNKVKRKRFTATQTKLNLEGRKENVKGAFQLKGKQSFENNTFIIFDDVITTGATVSELAKVLKEKKAKKIFALSIAIAE